MKNFEFRSIEKKTEEFKDVEKNALSRWRIMNYSLVSSKNWHWTSDYIWIRWRESGNQEKYDMIWWNETSFLEFIEKLEVEKKSLQVEIGEHKLHAGIWITYMLKSMERFDNDQG